MVTGAHNLVTLDALNNTLEIVSVSVTKVVAASNVFSQSFSFQMVGYFSWTWFDKTISQNHDTYYYLHDEFIPVYK